jgi:hypothetical protein
MSEATGAALPHQSGGGCNIVLPSSAMGVASERPPETQVSDNGS